MLNELRRLLALLIVLITLSACSAARGPGTALAQGEICEHGSRVAIQGGYLVQNNRWGSKTAMQCITVTGTGFRITQMSGSNDPDGWKNPPVGYPNVFLGCHYRSCSPDTVLPARLSQVKGVFSTVSFNPVSTGVLDAAYDIWLDSGLETPPEGPAVEIMIHLRQMGLPPLEMQSVNVGGRTWGLSETPTWWSGGLTQAIFVASSPLDAIGVNVKDFIDIIRSRHPEISDDWYLKMVSAGIECWSGCAGAGVDSFMVSVLRDSP